MRIAKLGLAIGATTALVVGLQVPASAATGPEYLYTTGGHAVWQADPYSGDPGDSVKACDDSSDGWGIKVTISWGDATQTRSVDTRGHTSGYCTGWSSGNIPEGTSVDIVVEQVRSDGHGNVEHGDWDAYTREA